MKSFSFGSCLLQICLLHGFPTCMVRVPLVVREGLPGGTRELPFFNKNLDSQLSSLRIGLCF